MCSAISVHTVRKKSAFGVTNEKSHEDVLHARVKPSASLSDK